MSDDAEVRLLFIPGPHGDVDLDFAETIMLTWNFQRMTVFYSMALSRPFTPDEIRESYRNA